MRRISVPPAPGAALLSAALLSAAPATAQRAPTLEQILAAPFAADLVAAPSGGRVAWVELALGERSIRVAGPPDYRGRPVARWGGDDGMRVTQLAFTPDGNAIVFTRGGNQRGTRLPDPPNPQLLPGGVREEVWIVPAAGGPPVRIDEGNVAAVSPRGDLVAYLKRDQVWAAPLAAGPAGATPGPPQQLVRDRGAAASLRWSPDGGRLAFVSNRGTHAFVGVYDVDARTLVFLDPSLDRDQEPAWSPDGTRVAFIRVPATLGELTVGPQRTARPWSIRVADARTGAGREVWRAAEGVGSAFWPFLGSDGQLFWGAGDRIAFPWERTGWVHLYSVPVAGGPPAQLSAGEFEVEHVALSPDRRELFFSSNQDDLDRRHLWRVAASGGPPRALTSGTGIEYWPVPTSDGAALAFLASGARVPPRAELLRLDAAAGGPAGPPARRVLAPDVMPAGFPAEALVEPRQVIFEATDGLRIHGQLFLPPGHDPGRRYPAVAYFHGGSRSQQVLGYNYLQVDYYQKHYALNQHLALQGYIVLSVNYRSGTGYGMEFREAPEFGFTGGSEVRDAIGAGRYLRSRPDVDPERIGAWGGSYGGYLTAMALATASELFAAGVDVHGVHAWDARLRFSPYSPLTAREQEEARLLARRSSPVGHVDTWRSPVLLIHGDDDRNVDFAQSVALAAMLRRRGVPVEELVIPNEEHSFLRHAAWLRAFEAAAEFFDRRLKRRAPRADTQRPPG